MKQGWEIKRLEDAVEFQRGLTYSKKDEVDFSDNIVLRSNNVDLIKNELDFTELKYINPAIEVQESKKVKKGSLLICTANGSKSHLGKVALIDDDYNYAFGGFMGQVTPKEKLDSKFLFYLMTSDNYKKFINELSDGANINNLKFSDLGQFEIPLPPLPEQQRIVSILDEAFAAIAKAKANAEQNLKNAKELFESYLQGVFEKKGDGWEEKPLRKVCQDFLQGINTATDKTVFVESGIPILQAKEIGNLKLDLSAVKYITAEAFAKAQERYKPIKGDILYNNIGSAMGRCIIVDWDFPFTIAWNVMRIIPNRNLTIPTFLNYILQTPSVVSKILYKAKGVGMPFISKKDLIEIKVSFPPLEEQQIIVRQLDALRAETQKLEAVYQQKIDDLEELKKSILQKAFAGELKTEKLELI